MRLFLAILLFSLTTQLAAQRDLRLELVRESLTGTHCRYREYVEGLPTDHWVTQPCEPQRQGELSIVSRHLPAREGRRFVEGRVIRRVIVEETPLQPYLHDYDEATGALVRRVPFFHRSRAARVFDPNPVVTLNDPGLQNQNDSPLAVPPSAYHYVELQDVAESGPLRGPHVTIVDRQAPAIAPVDASGSLLFDRSEPGFENVNAYFHVDRNQRHLQALGYTGSRSVVPYSIEIDTHAAGGADNSFFLPSPPRPGYGTLYFGTGGTDDAEDADLIVHEYGHAILEWISPGTYGGSFGSQSRALGEGFGDYWSYSAHFEARLASGRDLFCLADWDARCWLDEPESRCAYPPGSDCLRRVDSAKTMTDYETGDSAGLEHRNGTIWSSALREIHQVLVARYGTTEGRRISDSIVVESMFGAPPHPSFAAIARQMLEADRLLTGGLHRAPICAAMTSRSILNSCDDYPRGELTLVQSTGRGLLIPENDAKGVISLLTINDTRAIERLLVRVDIAHPSRGDLRIELIAPEGTTVVLQPLSLDRTADVRVTFGLTATPFESLDIFRGRSAAGVWQLVVRDLRPLDIGTLLSWGLMIQFEGDVPLASRPRSGPAQMVPVVANVFGAGMTRYLSDVRIANPGTEAKLATLVFTPSGSDGRSSFSAVDVVLGGGETASFENVVESLFQTTGSGSLEILGDVIVMSRTYATSGDGTLGQQVPPDLETTAVAMPPLLAAPLDLPGQRFNIGVTEIAGERGVVHITEVGDGAETLVIDLEPFSHVQTSLAWRHSLISVESGNARVTAYVSQIDERSGDAMFVPAMTVNTPRHGIAPALSAMGSDGREWRTDLWMSGTADIIYLTGAERVEPVSLQPVSIDVVGSVEGFARPGTVGALEASLPAEMIAHTRIVAGDTTQYVPFLRLDGQETQHLLFIENEGTYRTNLGIAAAAPALVVVSVLDASGHEIESHLLGTDGGIAQVAVGSRVSGGRAVVRILSGDARSYASLIDTRSGDATFEAGQ